MTDSERKRIQVKIDHYKKAMSDFKARMGFIDDGRGNRYEIPVLQMRLMDLTPALRYYTWFWKNFPDDIGEPIMNLAWTAMFFHRGETSKANAYFYLTLFSNPYLFSYVAGKPMGLYDMWHGANVDEPGWFENVDFDSFEFLTPQFRAWLWERYESAETKEVISRFMELNRKLNTEPVGEKRSALVDELFQLKYGGRGGI